MGKGDKKSKKGKIANGSYGVRRRRKARKELAKKAIAKKAVVKKVAAKKVAAPKADTAK
jgi:30S ribosomal protein S31